MSELSGQALGHDVGECVPMVKRMSRAVWDNQVHKTSLPSSEIFGLLVHALDPQERALLHALDHKENALVQALDHQEHALVYDLDHKEYALVHALDQQELVCSHA